MQTEFTLNDSRKPKARLIVIDYPFGDNERKQHGKRPRRQLRTWAAMGIPLRKITASLRGTPAKSPKRGKRPNKA